MAYYVLFEALYIYSLIDIGAAISFPFLFHPTPTSSTTLLSTFSLHFFKSCFSIENFEIILFSYSTTLACCLDCCFYIWHPLNKPHRHTHTHSPFHPHPSLTTNIIRGKWHFSPSSEAENLKNWIV